MTPAELMFGQLTHRAKKIAQKESWFKITLK
jgi:hypothetical protein